MQKVSDSFSDFFFLFQSQQASLSPFQICDHVFKMLYVVWSANQGRDLKLKMTISGKLFSVDKSLKLN